jgi:hypothetical protein
LEDTVKVTKTENEEKRILLDDANTEVKNLKADFDQQKSNFNEEKSALVDAVKVANAGNEVNCQFLEQANTRLTELKANFDQQKSILDKDKLSPIGGCG